MNIALSLLFFIIVGIFSTSFMELYNLPKFLVWSSLLPLCLLTVKKIKVPLIWILLFILNNVFLLRIENISFYLNLSIAITNAGLFTALAIYNTQKFNLVRTAIIACAIVISFGIYSLFRFNFVMEPMKASTLGNPAYTGSLVGPILSMLIIFYIEKIKDFKKDFLLHFWTLFTIIVVAIFLISLNSRASLLSFFGAMFFYCLYKRLFKTLLVAVVIFIIACASIPKLKKGITDYAQINLNDPGYFNAEKAVSSNLARFIFAANSIPMIQKFPIVGIGPGQFQSIYPLYSSAVYRDIEFGDTDHVSHPHNEPLNLMVERGIIVFGLIFLFLFLILKSPSVSILLKVGLVSMLVDSFILFNLQNPVSAFLFWIIIGLSLKDLIPPKFLSYQLQVPSLVLAFLAVGLLYPIQFNTLGSYFTRKAHVERNVQQAYKALQYNPNEVLAALYVGNHFLKSTSILEPLKQISATRNVVPTFPHPYQNTARIVVKAANETNLRISKDFYAMSLMFCPSSRFSALESSKTFIQNPTDYYNSIKLFSSSFKYYVRDTWVSYLQCEHVWLDRNSQQVCP